VTTISQPMLQFYNSICKIGIGIAKLKKSYTYHW